HRAVMLYLVQHMGCHRFKLAEDLDPAYAAAYRVARDRSVEMLCYGCDVSVTDITMASPIPILVP
ncbi:MAG: DNA/RNA nuclease SfsA, partial [Pseudomonadota bacterium]